MKSRIQKNQSQGAAENTKSNFNKTERDRYMYITKKYMKLLFRLGSNNNKKNV